MGNIFTDVKMKRPNHNTFDLSHNRKFTAAAGVLTPCFLAEAVPNDYFEIHTSQLVRVAPMVFPVMHQISIYVHFFFVPNRILWKGWEKFINGGYEGEDAPVFPFLDMVNITEINPGSLADYLGLPSPLNPANPMPVSAMPFAAYQKIHYEYYRDQNLDNVEPMWEPDGAGLADGDNSADIASLTKTERRKWQHDYFTSALPWTQRGPEATIPLGTQADIDYVFTGDADILRDATTGMPMVLGGPSDLDSDASPAGALRIASSNPINIDNSNQLVADLSTATAASINDLRRAFRLQEWLELNARAGARYNETIRAHFGIDPGDARLQRPQFLGGSSTPIVISEVLQTSSTDATTPQGNMSGHGVSIGGKNLVKYRCREHGYVMGIMSIMPKSAYQQGIPKHFQKFDKFDYFWKSFANIGEQAILNKEIYFDDDPVADEEVFGYTPRYAEYKFINDSVHGQFRTTLDDWHMGRIFSTRPTLNGDFVAMNPQEISRVFAVTQGVNQQFWVDMYHQVRAKRPMPFFGTPTL